MTSMLKIVKRIVISVHCGDSGHIFSKSGNSFGVKSNFRVVSLGCEGGFLGIEFGHCNDSLHFLHAGSAFGRTIHNGGGAVFDATLVTHMDLLEHRSVSILVTAKSRPKFRHSQFS